jgi:hypothetical protein
MSAMYRGYAYHALIRLAQIEQAAKTLGFTGPSPAGHQSGLTVLDADWWDIANRLAHRSQSRMQSARAVIFRLLRRVDDQGGELGVVVGRDIPRYGER